jgi:xylulose-5-phosphate/fructose-6-phosphate phosphoketolase
MVMLNDLDRFRLAADVLERVPGARLRHPTLTQDLLARRTRARSHA